MTILGVPSIDPALPVPGPDADWYTRELNRRLGEILAQMNLTLEPLARAKTNGDLLTADSDEFGGVDWVAAAGGDIWRGHRITIVTPVNSATTLTTLGDAFGAVGTGSGVAASSTNLLSSLIRYVTTTAAGANSQAGLNGTLIWWLGNASGLGGFRVETVFGVVTTQTTMRVCVGLAYNGAAAIPLTADPSAGTSCIFMGCDAADTNMQIMHNDAAGTCTKIDLGSSFPKTNNVVYRVVFTAAANASTVDYEVTRLDSAATASGTISTDLPANTVFMQYECRFGNGGTASAAAGAFMGYMGEHQ